MPGTEAQLEIMQPAGNFHHHVADTILPVYGSMRGIFSIYLPA